ncbi:hypothetical protein [Methylorubrum populi]
MFPAVGVMSSKTIPYGNIIAVLAMAAFPLAMTVLFARGPGYHDRVEGLLIIFFIFSMFSMLGGFLYIITKYAQYIGNLRFMQWVARNQNKFRVILALITLFIVLAISYFPRSERRQPTEIHVRADRG